ncbi:hypothetical protein GUITHDRAFT_136934 [Guillardia theta CCMP2712]|uniref:SAM domain-containing protein n=1 Tax=Guillardia theta (strain CCMP2712) TaxID=905079 RepID=L1JHI8_GUITC|nr:hypothetical protein GUITHDRAFT_136934 [Guillardia theta CCMP2712]EKX47961.1 hypothetical protein GUITHDRAFT_136934 [Guillardia theta CCMP2712]|eukprot:XP_005834941.1 hypothetical protein GUITHDRAFT_136934 [Guillardia theta CCMP2712]
MSPPEAKRSWQMDELEQFVGDKEKPDGNPGCWPARWETRRKATGFKGTQKKYICTHGMGHAYDKPCCKWEMVCEYVSEVEGEVAGWVVLRVMPEHNHDLDESCNLEEKRMRKQRKIANNFLFSMMHNEPYQPVGGSRAREEEASRKKIQSWLKELGLEELLPKFEEEKIDVEALAAMNEQELKEVGVERIGDRAKLRSRAQRTVCSSTNPSLALLASMQARMGQDV